MNPNWRTEELQDLCEIVIGRTPSRSRRDYWTDGSRQWLSIADMNQGRFIYHTKEKITDLAAWETSCRQIPTDTALLSFKLSIGKVSISKVPLYTNEAIAALPIRDNRIIDLGFLCCALRSMTWSNSGNRAAMGLTLNKSALQQLLIPVPPMREQRQIAMLLEQAEALRAKRRETLDQLDKLAESIFINMFSDLGQNRWPMVTVADVVAPTKEAIRTGPFGSQLLHEEFVDHGIAVLGIDNAVANEFRWNVRRFITSEKYQQLRRYTVYPGDVLITIMGTCGRCAIVPADIPTAINTKHLCCITLDRQKCLPQFLHAYFLKHPIAKKYLAQKAKGAIMSGLNTGIIKALPIPLAPTDLQRQFVRRIEAVERLRERHRAHLAELDALFESLQHRAFRGEL